MHKICMQECINQRKLTEITRKKVFVASFITPISNYIKLSFFPVKRQIQKVEKKNSFEKTLITVILSKLITCVLSKGRN